MKNLLICVLTVLCFASTNIGFSQTQKETVQEKILRLEVENNQLKRQNAELKKQIIQSQAKYTYPYYRTVKIQQLCEKYPACKKWAKERYQKDKLFEIKSIQTVVEQPASIPFIYKPDYKTATILQIDFRNSMRSQLFMFLKVALDNKPIQ